MNFSYCHVFIIFLLFNEISLKLISRDTLFRKDATIYNPTLSPDGKYVAFLKDFKVYLQSVDDIISLKDQANALDIKQEIIKYEWAGLPDTIVVEYFKDSQDGRPGRDKKTLASYKINDTEPNECPEGYNLVYYNPKKIGYDSMVVKKFEEDVTARTVTVSLARWNIANNSIEYIDTYTNKYQKEIEEMTPYFDEDLKVRIVVQRKTFYADDDDYPSLTRILGRDYTVRAR